MCKKRVALMTGLVLAFSGIAAQGETGGLLGEYYTGVNWYEAYDTGEPVLARIDPVIDFTWGSLGPDPSLIDGVMFAVRWRGEIEIPYSGTYTFTISSNDGARLYVDNALLVDDWGPPHGARDRSGTIDLHPGLYPIMIEHLQTGGTAELHFYWQHELISRQIIPADALLPFVIHGPKATNPSPDDESTDVLRDVILGWKPGIFANSHDVYLGMSWDDVNNASVANPMETLVSQGKDANSLDTGRLEFGQTYYWRVDEVNSPPDNTVFTGDVWSFMVEPFAYHIEDIIVTESSSAQDQGSENTVNGSGLNDSGLLHGNDSAGTMWLSSLTGVQPSWIAYEFDRLYKLHDMWIWNYNETWEQMLGVGVKDATIEYSVDGTDYMTLGTTHEFAQGPGTADYAHNTTVDFGGVTAKHVKLTANSNWGGGILNQYGLSEVRFLYIPVTARETAPASGATDVDVDVILGWRAGREAASHDVYVGADPNALALAGSVNEPRYDTASLALALGQSYYWRVDEVNDAETPTTWQGKLWSFSTQEFLVVDDFESYNDIEAGQEGSNLIYLTWSDGFDNPAANGSTIGYTVAFQPSMERQIVHGGNQSVPLVYDNSVASLSEVTVNTNDLAIGRDWTKNASKTLVLWFYGDPGNAATERMYVKVNGVKVPYPGDTADIATPEWKPWNVDLAAFGVDLSNVTQLSIGFERTGVSGGAGTVFIDDILLYRSIQAAE